jgi:hypothetical protein
MKIEPRMLAENIQRLNESRLESTTGMTHFKLVKQKTNKMVYFNSTCVL